jgi:ACS family hexuronate transporter-like MFS transporter
MQRLDMKKNMTNWRWWICLLLFLATTINYMDRQVLSLTWKDYIAPEFHWTDSDYGTIAGFFSLFYAFACLFAGRFVDWMGTKKGFLWAIGIWSVGACMHAGCGWLTMKIEGIESMQALKAIETGSAVASAVAGISVWLFLICRAVLAIGEGGNFPAAIKTTAEYFPKKDRALATALFNAGSSVGALAAPLTIPLLADWLGWEMAFIIIGALGFIWMFFWVYMYDKPEVSRHVNKEELEYINQDDNTAENVTGTAVAEKAIPFFKCLKYRQTWSFFFGKFLTDGVWWFLLFWAPAYFSECGYTMQTTTGKLLVFSLYTIVTVVSFGGGYLPKYFVENKGMEPYAGRMRAMLIFAFFPLLALFAQPLQNLSVWFPAVIIGLAGAGHQSWSANIFSTVGDMFPKSTIATITGIGNMAGGLAAFFINKGAGMLFDYAAAQGQAFTFMGFCGKPAGYMIIFCYCAVAYLLAWSIMKTLVPKHQPIIQE